MELVKVLEGLNHWVRSMYVKSGKLYSGTYQNISVWDAESFECEQNIDVKGKCWALSVPEDKPVRWETARIFVLPACFSATTKS